MTGEFPGFVPAEEVKVDDGPTSPEVKEPNLDVENFPQAQAPAAEVDTKAQRRGALLYMGVFMGYVDRSIPHEEQK